MMRCIRGMRGFSLLLLGSVPAALAAQASVTITGHVSAAALPVKGASVRIPALDVGATTDDNGRYAFIVSSTKVRGQTVSLTANYLRFRPKSVEISLVGGNLVRDFDMSAPDSGTPSPLGTPRARDPAGNSDPSKAPAASGTSSSAPVLVVPVARVARPAVAPVVDSTVLSDIAGSASLPSALTGRIAGLDVQNASTFGGSSSMLVRGPHSIVGLTQPLIALNGVLIDNSNLSSASQHGGTGGFDFGSGINDLNLQDIASVRMLSGAAAAMQFGGRAANGVLLITTKSGRGLNGFEVTASQQAMTESVLQLPSYQNAYGQGLAGKFAFFDGKGGGVNDATDQSWGPPLDGLPVTQASLTEAGRADVRSFLTLPNNVRDYFSRGRTITTNAAVQGGNETGVFRVSLSNRSATGVTPGSSASRQSALLSGSATPSARLTLNADLLLYHDHGENRPGTGFDESNPVSVFAHMPRSIDVAAYLTHLRDAKGAELSWSYNGHNNPYFAAQANDNHDNRARSIGGASATYAMSSWLTASARAGTDQTAETRSFTVASGWMGGFPYYAGRGDFSSGGFQNDDISIGQSNVDVSFRATPKSSGPTSFVFTVGAARRQDNINATVQGADKLVDTTTPAPITVNRNASTNSVFGGVEALFHDYASLDVTVRDESSALLSGASTSTLYPAVLGSLDLLRMGSPSARGGVLELFTVHGGWSRSGNDATAATLQRLGIGSGVGSAAVAQVSAPETTSGWEVGTSLRMFSRRVALDASYYDERSENLVLPSGGAFLRSGVLSNKGLEASIAVVPVRDDNGLEWTVGLTFSKNTNLVEALSGGVSSIDLAPSFRGMTVQARTGSSLGAIVGMGYLRDSRGALVLRSGHPLPDSVAGPRVLGESLPNWIGGLSTSVRAHGVELSVLFDAHHGGRIFSASNMVGAISGVLQETAIRPDSGLLIDGTDFLTGKQNTVHVTTEDYFHSLGAIGERWLYDASFVKLREARLSFTVPLQFVDLLRLQGLRGSVVARNLKLWSNAPNIDPETVLSASSIRGAELGQLPTTKSIGFQLSLTP